MGLFPMSAANVYPKGGMCASWEATVGVIPFWVRAEYTASGIVALRPTVISEKKTPLESG